MRRLVLVLVIVGWSCSTGDDDTLQPLPIEGGTLAPVGATTTAETGTTSTIGAGLPVPPLDPTSTSTPVAPAADWDGARFDAGTITAVGALGAYTSIELDRWSYTGPDGATVDAGGLDAEPIAAWWRVSPFSNVRVQTRTFVLATDVEVLTLDPGDRSRACADPPPAALPPPTWVTSGTSALGPTPPGDIALLTYSPTGQVTRVRLTHGC